MKKAIIVVTPEKIDAIKEALEKNLENGMFIEVAILVHGQSVEKLIDMGSIGISRGAASYSVF